MQGSLDQPPIVIESSRSKTILLIVICTVFVAIGWWMTHSGQTKDVVFAWLGIGFFGLGIPAGLIQLVRPATLEIGPTGVTLRTVFRAHSYRWSDVKDFRVFQIKSAKLIGFDFTDSYPGQRALSGMNRSIAGVEASLPGLSIGADQLCELLTAAQARWS